MSTLTYNDVLDAYAEYPAPIRPYLVRAETHPLLRSLLTKSAMRIVIDIVARAPIADPTRGLLLRVENIAEKFDLSTKTVSRALSIMRARGWLVRRPGTDGRNNWGEFCSGEFLLGDELRKMLGMPVQLQAPPPTAESPASAKVIESDQVDLYPSETKKSPGPYRVNKVSLKVASFQKDASQKPAPKSPVVPRDLVPMATELGIMPEGMCALMRAAKAAQQRLQDIWLAKRDTILNAGATGGRAKAYIETLLRSGEDFAYRARKKSLGQAQRKMPQVPSPMATATLDRRHYWNKKYTGNGVTVTIHGDGSAEVRDGKTGSRYVRPADMEPVYEAIASGKLSLKDE